MPGPADHDTLLPVDATRTDSAPTIAAAAPTSFVPGSITARLQAGSAFGRRYRILQRLGEGGMGIVYKAWDEELSIPVALKLIRPEAMTDADAALQMERRFKRELVLARQVTHKNVVRIHDLGELDTIKYFTMPFIEGQDLSAVIGREGKLSVARALRIARQVATGLAAAHEVGIVHRDLKPENVMLDADDTAVIMDFGLARTNDGANLTMAGAVMGTLAYMAPEHARGEAVDQRVDIYAWGLMLYDMVAGRRRVGQHRDAMSELFARMQEAPRPIRTLEPHVPQALEALITRSVDPNRDRRFATTQDLIAALDGLDAEGFARQATATTPIASGAVPRRYVVLASVLALAVLFAGGWWLLSRGQQSPPMAQREPMLVLVSDFVNGTGDPLFTGSLENVLSLGIEGASFINAFPRREAFAAAARIRPDARLDETTARLVCQSEGIRTLLVGSIAAAGAGYTVSVRAIDPVPGTVLAEVTESAADKSRVLEAVGALSAKVRSALGDATPQNTMAAQHETFTTSSLVSAREYAEGQALANANRDEEAIAAYQRALADDPRLGRAYAGWAASAFKLGRTREAEELYQKAFALVDRMTEREKFRTFGTYYLNITRNYEKAVEQYQSLVAKYPADGAAHNNLALANFNLLQFTQALEQGQRVLGIYPRSALYRYNYALYAMYAGNFPTAASEARTALEINANLPKAHLAIAMAALAAGNVDEAKSAYENARGAGPRGASLAAIGLADLAMYQGRFDEAVPILEQGLKEDDAAKNLAGAAAKAMALAEAHHARADSGAAATAVQRARQLSSDPSVLVPAARVLAASGRSVDADRIAEQLASALAPRSRAYARVVKATTLLERGRPAQALDELKEAQRLADLWIIRFLKGVAYVEARAYAEALSELELCEKRRGEATAVFLDDIPSYRYMVPLSYWLGRAHDGLGARDAAQRHLRAYLSRRSPATDALAKDAEARNAK
ncbi:MAG TPA: protein kinase [Vicinamibacterales bacterium]|nr:protein kinase [Vicinamibacterales bacterium]